jgi:hypothetical protein
MSRDLRNLQLWSCVNVGMRRLDFIDYFSVGIDIIRVDLKVLSSTPVNLLNIIYVSRILPILDILVALTRGISSLSHTVLSQSLVSLDEFATLSLFGTVRNLSLSISIGSRRDGGITGLVLDLL